MRLPAIQEIPASTVYTDAFRGYNHNRTIRDDEFFEMENLSSDEYPVLAPRSPRRLRRSFLKPHGIHSHEKLCWVDGTDFYYDGVVKGTVSDTDKQFVSMGAYVVIWPDKKIYNSQDATIKNLDVLDNAAEPVWTSDPLEVSRITVSHEGETQECMQIKTLKSADFRDNDVVTIQYQEWKPGKDDQNGELVDVELISHVFYSGELGSVKCVCLPYDEAFSSAYTSSLDYTDHLITISRSIPNMDYVCELGNRLWGCSTETNELFCSALGDPFNWNVFKGDSQDSWAVNVGTTGPFTGACAYQNSILFFKEDDIHRVYGTRPSNFQVSTIHGQGVEAGSAASLCILNERVYYKSRRGVCVFAGNQPSLLSDALGDVQYTGAAAAAFGDKVYISMTAVSDPLDREWDEPHGELLVYDTAKGLWHKEGRESMRFLAVYDGNLLMVDESGGLVATGPDQTGELEKCVTWMAQTGRLLFRTPDHKHISKIKVQATLYEGSTLKIEIRYDGTGPWNPAAQRISRSRIGYVVPIIPMRCETFELRLSGAGEMRILGISYTLEQGSEI